MKYIKISSLGFLFIILIPFLALGQTGPTAALESSKTKQELKKEWFKEVLRIPTTKAMFGVPVVSPFADWDYYYTRNVISWRPEGKYENKYRAVEVPTGFVTDLASIPKIFLSILPRTARYTNAAIIHDYLYWMQTGSKEDADEILKIGMQELKVEPWKVVAIYEAVTMLGKGAWEENGKLKANGEKRFLKKYPDNPMTTWVEWKKKEGVFAE